MNLLLSSQTGVTTPVSESEISGVESAQLDYAILRLSTVLRRARNIKNTLSPINQFPPETLAHIATFLPADRDLINATAICQHWRTILLSFPRLWCNPSGPPSKIRAYVQRSKSTPTNVKLSSPELVELVAPHASRLVGLTLRLHGKPYRFSQVIEHLPYPTPTLHSLRVVVKSRYRGLEFPSGPQNTFCFYLKRLEIVGISTIRGPQTFPYVTELTMYISYSWWIEPFLNILERFPVLERLYVTFHRRVYTDSNPRVVTLPHVQEMKLSPLASAGVPMQTSPILEYLQLPNLKSLSIRVPPKFVAYRPVFSITSFGERFPTLSELSEVHVKLGASIGEATFRSSSQATLEYLTRPFTDYVRHERKAWRDFPLHFVWKLVVDMVSLPSYGEVKWLIGLWRDLTFLADLEIGGECYRALGILRDHCSSERLPIRTLTVRDCGERERIQALELKRSLDASGLDVSLVCIPDPRAQEVIRVEVDANGLGGE